MPVNLKYDFCQSFDLIRTATPLDRRSLQPIINLILLFVIA